jgi:hypothetical protein
MIRTIGLSPKAVLAFLFPLVSTVCATVAVWVNSGTFNAAELRTALAGTITSAAAALGAYLGHPGRVVDGERRRT